MQLRIDFRHLIGLLVVLIHNAAAFPLRNRSRISLGLPFGESLNLQDVTFPSVAGDRFKEPGEDRLQINLPFSDIALPFSSLIPQNGKGLTGGLLGSERPVLRIHSAPASDVTGALHTPDASGNQTNVTTERTAGNVAMDKADRPERAPVGVINLPFYKMNLPLSQISQKAQPLPPQAKALSRPLIPREGFNNHQSPPSARSFDDGVADLGGSLMTAGLFPNSEAIMGNLDSPYGNSSRLLSPLSKSSFPGADGVSNRLEAALSVMNFPYNAFEMPLSRLLLPLSRIGSGSAMFGGLGSLTGSEMDAVDSSSVFKESPRDLDRNVNFKNSEDGSASESSGPFEDYSGVVSQLQEDLRPQTLLNIQELGLPYSFLNNPLAFFNLPFAFTSLPLGSFNLPFAHLHTPLGSLNPSFIDMMQTFSTPLPGAPVSAGRDFSGMDGVELDFLEGRHSEPDLKISDPSEAAAIPNRAELERRRLLEMADIQAKAAKAKIAEHFAQSSGTANVAGSSPASARSESAQNIKNYLDGLFGSGDASPMASQRKAASAEQVLDEIDRATETFRSAVPAVPELGGRPKIPLASFLTPYSLMLLPFSFVDTPMAFNNLPLSHFNLPLSHLTLPFGKFDLPFDDTRLPPPAPVADPTQLDIEASDLPPSALQALDSENLLTSYLNLPISEMNLPFTIFHMPLNVMDLPFSYLLLPFSELNTPFTNLHLPLELATLPLSETKLPFQNIIPSLQNLVGLDQLANAAAVAAASGQQ